MLVTVFCDWKIAYCIIRTELKEESSVNMLSTIIMTVYIQANRAKVIRLKQPKKKPNVTQFQITKKQP